MSRLLAWAATVGAISSLAVSASAAGPVCGPPGDRTLAIDAVARIYRAYDTVVGCAAGGSRSYVLGRRGGNLTGTQAVGLIRLAGRVVAWTTTQGGVDTIFTNVRVLRLTDGHSFADRSATTRIGVEGFASVGSLVVRANGSVAWTGSANSIGPPHTVRQVERLDGRGFRVLEDSPSIVIASLHLHRSTISWRDGSGTHSATLR